LVPCVDFPSEVDKFSDAVSNSVDLAGDRDRQCCTWSCEATGRQGVKSRLFLVGQFGRSIHSRENLKKYGWCGVLGRTSSSELWFGVFSCSSMHRLSGVTVRSVALLSSSELLPPAESDLAEPPNMERSRPQRRFGGWPSEPVESAELDRRCDVTFSGGTGGTTRSKETNRFTGDS
jgi:hypothetical protein